jgi:protein arginine N-methyltransferase 1
VKPTVLPLPLPLSFAGSYRDASTHRALLQDVVRTTSYDEALREVVKPTSRVLDFGTGTGVLAVFAARHGAARVEAMDRSSFVRHARRIAIDSGHPEIRFHHADQDTFSTDGKVDVIVSEWMGHFLFFEAMMGPLLELRDRWLAEDGVMVPARMGLHAALLTDESLHDELAFFLGNPYGMDFSTIAEVPLRRSHRVRVDELQVNPCRFDLGTLEMRTVTAPPECLTGTARVEQGGLAYGVVGWFSADLTKNTRFGTGPDDTPTHWGQLLFPFPEPFLLVPGRELTLKIEPPRQPEHEDPTWAWFLTDGVETLSIDERATFAEADADPDVDA